MPQDSYGEAAVRAQRALAEARLNDPGEHFPYKYDRVHAAIDANHPAGPDGPGDGRARVEDFISRDIADRTADYIDAQAAYLTDPGDATRAMYRDAADRLEDARAAHRRNRIGVTVTALRALRADE